MRHHRAVARRDPPIGRAGPEEPDSRDLGAIHTHADEAIDRLYALWNQAVASLVKFAAQIEGTLGLPPLPELRKESVDEPSD